MGNKLLRGTSICLVLMGIYVQGVHAGREHYIPDYQTQMQMERVAELYVDLPRDMQSDIDDMLASRELPNSRGSAAHLPPSPELIQARRHDYARLLQSMISGEKARYERDAYKVLVKKDHPFGERVQLEGRVSLQGQVTMRKTEGCFTNCVFCNTEQFCKDEGYERGEILAYTFNTESADPSYWFDYDDHLYQDHSEVSLGYMYPLDILETYPQLTYEIVQNAPHQRGHPRRIRRYERPENEIVLREAASMGKNIQIDFHKLPRVETMYIGHVMLWDDVEVSLVQD